VLSIIEAAGWPIWLIIVTSITALAIIGERFWSLRTALVAPREILPATIREYQAKGVTQDLVNRLQRGPLIGRIFAAALVGRLAELGWDRNFLGAVAAFVVGNLVIYAFGVPWLMLATGLGAGGAIANGVSPFLFGDGLKILAAAALFPAAWWIVGRRPAER